MRTACYLLWTWQRCLLTEPQQLHISDLSVRCRALAARRSSTLTLRASTSSARRSSAAGAPPFPVAGRAASLLPDPSSPVLRNQPWSGRRKVDFDELLAKSNIVDVMVPLSDSTRGMINKETLAKMPKGSWIVNTGTPSLKPPLSAVHWR